MYYDSAWRYKNINSFDDIKRQYDRTHPINGRRHTFEEDIRPVFKRSHPHKRYVKLSDTKYGVALDLWMTFWEIDLEAELDEETKELLCQVVWERLPDGRDKLTVRNGLGNGYHATIYTLTNCVLPRELSFRYNRDGKHYIVQKGTKRLLPKIRYGTPLMRLNTVKYQTGATGWCGFMVDDGEPAHRWRLSSLEKYNYKQEYIRELDGSLSFLSGNYKFFYPKVDVQKKKQLFKPGKLKAFIDYVTLVNAMTHGSEHSDFFGSGKPSEPVLLHAANLINSYGEIEDEDQHLLAVSLAARAGVVPGSDPKHISNAMHREINALFDLYSNEEIKEI